MIEYSQTQNPNAAPPEDLSFKVIGVGGAGANVLDRLALEGSDDAQLIVLNTDIRKLSSSVSSQKVQLGSTLLKGMGTGGDPNLGKQAAIEASDDIRDIVRNYDMVFVCVGLGGGTGSGAAPEVCRIAREEGVFLVTFGMLPFEFEGARRTEQAREALEVIEGYSNAVVTFDNDRMGELIVPKDGVTQAFAAADKIISQSIRAVMNVVSKPGIIRIGMDDLLTALNNESSRCLFGYGQAKGDNRALEAVDQTLKCPLLDRGKLLNEVENVLIQVSGSDSMTLLEVQTVMNELTKHLRPNAHVLFGTGTDSRLGSSLAVTIISSLNAEQMSLGVSSNSPQAVQVVQPAPVEVVNTRPSPLAAAVAAAAAVNQPQPEVVEEVAAVAYQEPEPVFEPEPEPVVEQQPEPVYEPEPVVEQQPEPVYEPEPVVEQQPEPVYEPTPEVVAESNIVAMPQFSGGADIEPAVNPIATAVQQAQVDIDQPVEMPPIAETPGIVAEAQLEPAPAEPAFVEVVAAPIEQATVEPVAAPIEQATIEPVAAPIEPATVEPVVARIEQVTVEPVAAPVELAAVKLVPAPAPIEQATIEAPAVEPVTIVQAPAAVQGDMPLEPEVPQSIALSQIVPGQTSQRILSRAPKEAVPEEIEPELPATTEQQFEQQQDILQLEPVQAKGRFAQSDPTIVDGEDLDVPTFLRKKG